MNIGPSWTDERIGALRKLWADGMSASKIAAELGGVTRSSVIGKVHRLMLPGRKTIERKPAYIPVGKIKISKPRWKPAPPPEPEPIVADLPPDTSPFACTIADLGFAMCRFPLGDPTADMNYCGAVSAGPWCARHRAIVFSKWVRG